MLPPPSQNTVEVCKQITLLFLYYISSRLLTSLKAIDAPKQFPNTFYLTVSFKFLNFRFQLSLLFFFLKCLLSLLHRENIKQCINLQTKCFKYSYRWCSPPSEMQFAPETSVQIKYGIYMRNSAVLLKFVIRSTSTYGHIEIICAA